VFTFGSNPLPDR
jgi:hypothetical protein